MSNAFTRSTMSCEEMEEREEYKKRLAEKHKNIRSLILQKYTPRKVTIEELKEAVKRNK